MYLLKQIFFRSLMEKTFTKRDVCNLKSRPFQEDSDFNDQIMKFLWQTSFDRFDKSQIKSWGLYDEDNQNHLILIYEKFSQDPSNFCFPLLCPLNDYYVNFKKLY